MVALEPDIGMIAQFVETMFRHADVGGHLALRCFRDDIDGAWNPQAWSAPRIEAGGLGAVISAAARLAGAAAAAVEPVVFAPPVATFRTAGGAAEKDIFNGVGLMVECDTAPEAARERLENVVGPTTVVVASGGIWIDPNGIPQDKLHLHWLLAEPTREFADHVKLKEARRLAQILVGADATAVPPTHPVRWPGSWHRKAEPRLCRIVSLRAEAEITLDEALGRLRQAAGALGPTSPAKGKPGAPGGGPAPARPAEALDIAAALAVIENNDLGWKAWNDIALATWRASNGSEAGFAAFCAWSSKSAKFDRARTRQRWDHIAEYPPDRIGAGTLFHLAGLAWPGFVRPSEQAKKTPPGARPVVELEDGRLPQLVDQVETLMIRLDPELFEFGDAVVRPAPEPIKIADRKTVIGLRLVPVSPLNMVDRLTRAIDFRRYDGRSKKWRPTNCPREIASTYLARVGGRRLRKLTALATAPVMRPDGTVLDEPGYDASTGIFYDPRGAVFPAIPARPTRDLALAALAELKLPFHEFPFIDEASCSVLLSALLCAVARLAFPFAPCHAFDAPAAGTGKSKLINCCAILATGYECPVASQGKDETEMEKRLGAMLLAGDRIISLDNCDAPLGGQLLCQIITQGLIRVRVLGESRMVTIPNHVLMFANGNNLRFVGDMLRRGLIGRLDAGVERPELREFVFEDPEITLKRERGKYVAAALTVLRAHIVADRPERMQPLGGFEGWSELVREALIWLGEADPVDTIEKAREDDPQRLQLGAVLAQWDAVLGGRRVSAKDAVENALAIDMTATPGNRFLYPDFRSALLAVAAGDQGRIDTGRLGHWLRRQKGKVIGGRRFVRDGILDGITRWRLQRQTERGWE